jgi:1-deoxy-D-xylulose-5-phosphate reductoisomerase
MKKIAILGSTGSIGVNALKVIRANPEKYEATALAAGKNIDLLLKQIEGFRPAAVSVLDEDLGSELKNRLGGNKGPKVFYGNEGFVRLATLDQIDTVISAMTGAAGLLPTYEAIKAGKDIALANKETMVMAGHLIMTAVKKHGVSLVPIDSEHSAVLQSLQGHTKEDLRRVILTASGGPFRDASMEQMTTITPAQALNHPNWHMGPKISIDSATMMNKGLETIEAKWLFDLEMAQIGILIHPQSVVHSMVEYKDGSVIAQLGIPDMMIPISYALSFPHHLKNSLSTLRLEEIGMLNFEKPDMKKFPCLELAFRAANIGASMPAVLNAANEIAVESFLDGKIAFLDIPELIDNSMDAHHPHHVETIEMVMAADRWARKTARGLLKN